MNLALRFLGLASCVGLVAASACGGKVRGDPGAAGSAGADMGTTTGRPATTTGGTTSGSATTGAGGTIGPEPVPTCESVCQHFMNFGCAQPECVASCEDFRVKFPMCVPILDDLLRCLETSPIFCGPNGTDVKAPGCEPFSEKLTACAQGPVPPPPPIDAGPPQCGTPPPGPMSCSGGGGGSATTSGGGPGGSPSCFTQCNDASGNTWSANCVGNTCSCTYNGVQYCSCTTAGPSCLGGPSCCPGLP
jgi:hypothetical protein